MKKLIIAAVLAVSALSSTSHADESSRVIKHVEVYQCHGYKMSFFTTNNGIMIQVGDTMFRNGHKTQVIQDPKWGQITVQSADDLKGITVNILSTASLFSEGKVVLNVNGTNSKDVCQLVSQSNL